MAVRERVTEVRRGRLTTVLAIVGALVIALFVLRRDFVDLPDWFGGGESDPAPRGTVLYEEQEARSASENLLVDVGNGEAIVSVKAKQNHDRPGSILNGDFQSTNGTSSVADPDDRDVPANLVVKTDYCADGLITTTETPAGDGGDPVVEVRLEMGDLFVCNTTLEHTADNDAAFQQDDTPTDFHGEFVAFVAGAVETTAAAAPCPDDELERFAEPELLRYLEGRLAEQFDLPRSRVEIVAGEPGRSDEETRGELRDQLESYANHRDPDDPDRTYEALSIEYLTGDGDAVADSCYRDPGEQDLETLEDVDAPDVR
jgi:hypothetical protein